ncbi:hypothetical protein VKT23_003471 [Stygiomarasmius scandens]|uniref:C2H2-type domain-containing protein n=1 Tax=Marasmiellus scandens TaxID=2682957 RepID=A0ABR1JXB8_9AGAR
MNSAHSLSSTAFLQCWSSPVSNETGSSNLNSPSSPDRDSDFDMPWNPRIGTEATRRSSFQRRKRPAKYGCTVPGCGQDFTAIHNLRNHMNSHNGIKPYKCNVCACNGHIRARQTFGRCVKHKISPPSCLPIRLLSTSNAKDLGKTTGVTYAIDSVQGEIKTANLEFAGSTVQDQAYNLQSTPFTQSKCHRSRPNTGSNVFEVLANSDTGRAVVNRIFLQNTSTPNLITVNLGRIEDPDDPFPPSYRGLSVPTSISITTSVDETPNSKQATAVIDTGFSFSQAPKIVADAFYSRFDGAEYVNVNGISNTWIVPCTIEGTWYPIHPLDAIMGMSDSAVTNSNGDECCIGMFQPVSFDTGDDPTYHPKNRGPRRIGETTFLQMLSTTDVSSSHLDFVEMRLGGVDTTGEQNLNAPNFSSDDSSSKSSKNSKLKVIFLGLAIAAGVLGIVILLWAFCCRRRANRGKGGKGVKPNAGWMAYGGYGRLGDPNANAGPGAYPFQGLSSSSSQPQPVPENQRYSHPYSGSGQGADMIPYRRRLLHLQVLITLV